MIQQIRHAIEIIKTNNFQEKLNYYTIVSHILPNPLAATSVATKIGVLLLRNSAIKQIKAN